MFVEDVGIGPAGRFCNEGGGGVGVLAFFRVVQGAEGVPAGEDQPDGVQVPDESLVRGKGQGHFFFSGKLQEGASKVGGGYAAKGVLQAFYVVSDGAGIEGKALGSDVAYGYGFGQGGEGGAVIGKRYAELSQEVDGFDTAGAVVVHNQSDGVGSGAENFVWQGNFVKADVYPFAAAFPGDFPAVYEDSADVLQILQGEGNSGGQGVYVEPVGHGNGVAQPGAAAFVFYLIPGLEHFSAAVGQPEMVPEGAVGFEHFHGGRLRPVLPVTAAMSRTQMFGSDRV